MSEAERLRSIHTFPSLVKYLRDELDWPIETDDFNDLTFEYEPEELVPDAKVAAKIQDIKQLRPLTDSQPWGIFFIKFEPRRLPIVVMRRILRSLVVRKRHSAQKAERPYWQMHDLLFVSSYGESGDRVISFAHFSESDEPSTLPALRVLAWDDKDTVLHLDHAHETLKERLRWPDDEEDLDAWRTTWGSAFTLRPREVIRTSKKLAQRMAELATRIRNRAGTVLEVETENGPLTKLYKAFREALIHDLTPDDFADMYAQTVTYGLFAAACSRPAGLVAENLADMVPVTNPFLKELLGTFLEVGGKRGHIDFDELGVNEVVDLLTDKDTDLEAIKRDFGDLRQEEDPVIHFYELFLSEYDRKKKIQRGVFFTPRPVVSFIVRSVHEILQTEFGLEDGLADTTTWGEMAERHEDLEIPEGVSPDEPFVQILDPACGTGTFLVEVIELIHKTMVEKWRAEGHMDLNEIPRLWNQYVPEHLLPRLYGFELMMAPYTICHMKAGLKLNATDYRFGANERLRVYLTNSLEPPHDFSDRFEFDAPALAHEARAVNTVKRHQRFTAVIGNPPYSNFGQMNKNPFILDLLQDYKHGLGEKMLNLDDDFIKFVRYAQSQIESTQVGVLGMITNSTYIDGITHRRMRESLMEVFPLIRILDLHGSVIKSQAPPDGTADVNVFDIRQGVAIGLLAKRPESSRRLISHADLLGSRESKYRRLSTSSCARMTWNTLSPQPRYFFFIPRNTTCDAEWEIFFPINEAMPVATSAVQTKRDALFIDFDLEALSSRMQEVLAHGPKDNVAAKYPLEPSAGWKPDCLNGVQFSEDRIRPYLYRPFDIRFIYYDDQILGRSRKAVFRHLLRPNLALATLRQTVDNAFRHVFCTQWICDINLVIGHHVSDRVFPLYLYEGSDLSGSEGPRQNFSRDFLAAVRRSLSLGDVNHHSPAAELEAEDIFHYAYAVLHSPSYRSRYAEFLKTDFPRLPLASSMCLFRALADFGSDLAALHLLQSPRLTEPLANYDGTRDPKVEKVAYADQTVWLDKKQTCGFVGVPEGVWNFYVGGYQVCHKWLKDRRGRALSDEDIEHYQKIIVAISETIRIMGEIDEVIEEHGGWPDAFITEPMDTESEEASRTVSAPSPPAKAAKKPDSGKGNFALRSDTRTVTGRLDLEDSKAGTRQQSAKKAPAGKAKSGSVSIKDFDRDQLKGALLEVVGTDWIERDDAIRDAARHLGFARTGKRIKAAFKSAITGLLRQNRLESAGTQIRRA